jgi:hypothetical protein
MHNFEAKYESERVRAEQLVVNCRWLIEKIDTIFYALCPNKIGTWQQRAEMAALKAVELANKRSRKRAKHTRLAEIQRDRKQLFKRDPILHELLTDENLYGANDS